MPIECWIFLSRLGSSGEKVTNKSVLPTELKGKFPRRELMLVQGRVFWELFGLGLCLAGPSLTGLRGGIVWARHSPLYVWTCFAAVGAVLGPMASVLVLLWFPIQPYRDSLYFPARRSLPADKRDPIAKRVADLFASAAARRFTMQAGLKLSAILLLTMTIITALRWEALANSLGEYPSKQLAPSYILCAIGAFGILKVEILNWAFKNWDGGVPPSSDLLSLETARKS
jgi:hypothetical protein